MSNDPTRVRLPNEHLDLLTSDYLFHLDVPLGDPDTVALFSDVKFVCVGGTSIRMEKLARHFARAFQRQTSGEAAFDYSFTNERYSGYKVGPVFCVNHGIGTPSTSIVLHEVFKLLQKAQCSGVTLIRVGTCGGIGVPGGTVVISTGALTAGLVPVFSTSSLGERLALPAVVDQGLVNDLKDTRTDSDGYQVVCGHTYCSDDFYQGQGRLDGSFCDYGRAEQRDFLKRLYEKGVRNIEMESAGVLALSHRVGIKAAVVCVVLVDRLQSDLPTVSADELREYQERPIRLITRFILNQLALGA